MFKNIAIYTFIAADAAVFDDLEDKLQFAAFVACGPTQEKAYGWVPPRGQTHGDLVEAIGGQLIFKLQTETRAVPKEAIEREFTQRCAAIEASTGRKPGKKEGRDLKDDIHLTLLPHAFSKLATSTVWIDRDNSRVVINASSQAHADAVASNLVQSLEGLVLAPLQTQVPTVSAMAEWLLEDIAPSCFTVDRECELKASDESKAVVRYNRHALDINEVKDHITAGKVPTKLALTWNDKVSFLLTDILLLKKLEFLDVAMEAVADGHSDAFDANVAITTGCLALLITDLVKALGGEVNQAGKSDDE